MLRLAGIFIFAPDSITHHGVGKFVLDDEGDLVVAAKTDAALCEALES